MTEKTMELLEAALVLLPFLKTSTDAMPPEPPLETPAQRLRREADEMEAKDAAIERLRAAVAAFEEG
jgi:hypothetical protein